MLSINKETMKVVREVLESPESLDVIVETLPNGTTTIDFGQKCHGGWAASRYYTLITLGGIGEVSYEPFVIGTRTLNAVRVMHDKTLETCLGSQVAGWRLEDRPNAPTGCGPARALNKNPDNYFKLIDYHDI